MPVQPHVEPSLLLAGAQTPFSFASCSLMPCTTSVKSAQQAHALLGGAHKATLACLLTATARAPLLRTSLNPADGEIRLRVDCPCSAHGARDGDLLKAVSLLPWFADNISPHISAAMEKGSFDPSQVGRFHYPKPRAAKQRSVKLGDGATSAGKRSPAPTDAAGADRRARAEALSKKPGGSPGRLTRLHAFHQWLASLEQQQRKQQHDQNDRLDPPTEKKESENDGHDA